MKGRCNACDRPNRKLAKVVQGEATLLLCRACRREEKRKSDRASRRRARDREWRRP